MKKRIAVVLFNLGGPDSLSAVRPFLFNLFNDPAIIGIPAPFRWILAHYIAFRRAPVARNIYRYIGGKSPLLAMSQQQARELERQLSDDGDIKCFVAMRYWHPMISEISDQVKKFGPDEIVLLPLYPQYSSTTTGSSLTEWQRAAKEINLSQVARIICCYPTMKGWVAAQVDLISHELKNVSHGTSCRILFSAHGLPKKIIDSGDPYQIQIEQTVEAIVADLPDGTDWVICYQSRVGRLEWIGPSTEKELGRAADDGVEIVIVPIAFVSEHSETLVELDIEYRELAEKSGISGYYRVPTVGTNVKFINGLADLVRQSLNCDDHVTSDTRDSKGRCLAKFDKCPLVK